MTRSYICLLILLLVIQQQSLSQTIDSTSLNLQTTGMLGKGDYSPFWLNSNRLDLYSINPNSSTLLLGMESTLKWGSIMAIDLKLTGYAMLDNNSKLDFHEIYIKPKIKYFTLTVGKKRFNEGNQCKQLSSGGFLFSNNSSPMPVIEIAAPSYFYVPYTFNLIEVKGTLGHGWQDNHRQIKDVYIHYKTFYIRVGGELPINIDFGILHAAQWGGVSEYYGKLPSSFNDFRKIFFGSEGDESAPSSEQANALGNHIISQNLGIDFKYKHYTLRSYIQNLNEDGPVRFLPNSVNKLDMLWGVSLSTSEGKVINSILFEYFNSKDQSGPYHDKDGIAYGGNDSYFNNGIYPNGWSFFGRTIGNPLITSPLFNSDGSMQFKNNRVTAHHIGIKGEVVSCSYRIMYTKTKNYGTYTTPQNLKNSSFLFEVSTTIFSKKQINGFAGIGIDRGQLFGNSWGFLLGLSKNITL